MGETIRADGLRGLSVGTGCRYYGQREETDACLDCSIATDLKRVPLVVGSPRRDPCADGVQISSGKRCSLWHPRARKARSGPL